jgi:hypothetical protein
VQNSSIARARGNPLVQLQLQLVRVVSNSYQDKYKRGGVEVEVGAEAKVGEVGLGAKVEVGAKVEKVEGVEL